MEERRDKIENMQRETEKIMRKVQQGMKLKWPRHQKQSPAERNN